LSVNPGFGGQTFIHSSLKKIELLSNIGSPAGSASALKLTAASITTLSRRLFAQAPRSWSQAAPYSSRGTQVKMPGIS